MRMIVVSALVAAGVAFAGAAATSATTLGSGLGNAAVNATQIERTALICRQIEVCHRGPLGRRVCKLERVCRERW
jgi:hypothetical protein